MTSNDKAPTSDQSVHTPDQGQTAPGLDGAVEAPVPAADQLSELEALQAENAALKDRLLRAMAEMENLRRRTEKESADAKTYGVTNFARDMLTFSDNLNRAVENAPKDAEGLIKALVEGLGVTEADFISRLARHGVKKQEPLGKKFDPNLQEALFEIPDETVPNGTVLQVVEAGFMIGERVLRPAKVGVSRGGPKN